MASREEAMTADNYQGLCERLDGDARSVALRRYLALRAALLRYGTVKYDIEGALAAGQYGVAYLRSRSALQFGVETFLLENGSGIYGRSGHWLAALDELCSGSGPVHEHAWSLECENPSSPEEIVAYAAKCVAFTEGIIQETGWLLGLGNWDTDENLQRLVDSAEQWATLANDIPPQKPGRLADEYQKSRALRRILEGC